MNHIFKALDDPTRREILNMLKEKDMTAGEIADKFNISKPSISHHLDILKQAKLVVAIKQGQFQLYSLNTTIMDEIIQWMMNLNKK
jgi:ArsR family transcriptional regulator, arsenate/arsenite/antimonite-responsive transcriptional repressor